MNRFWEKENEIKLDILRSLARSQEALANMLETLSGLTPPGESESRNLQRQMGAIGQYQRILAMKIASVRFPQKKTGIPAPPWISPSAKTAVLKNKPPDPSECR